MMRVFSNLFQNMQHALQAKQGDKVIKEIVADVSFVEDDESKKRLKF